MFIYFSVPFHGFTKSIFDPLAAIRYFWHWSFYMLIHPIINFTYDAKYQVLNLSKPSDMQKGIIGEGSHVPIPSVKQAAWVRKEGEAKWFYYEGLWWFQY